MLLKRRESFLFCVFSLLIIHSCSFLSAFESEADIEPLIREYSSSHFTKGSIVHICHEAEKLWDKKARDPIKSYSFSEIQGRFYKLQGEHSVLYTPPLTPPYMIDKGAFKRVYKALYFTSNSKSVVAACVGPKKSLLHEVVLFKKTKHLYENPYLCSFPLSSDSYMLVLRYYNLGNLRKLRDAGHHFTDEQKISLARCLVSALIGFHEQGIAHRDIHDGNILLRQTNQGEVRAGLIDLGRATSLSATVNTVPQGAYFRNPPEVLLGSYSQVDKRLSDIYALGCSLYYIFFSKIYDGAFLFHVAKTRSWKAEEKKKLYVKVQKAYTDLYKQFLEKRAAHSFQEGEAALVDHMKNAIFLMLNPDPKKRISLSKVWSVLSESTNAE